jgi:RHS repeat-associated protein
VKNGNPDGTQRVQRATVGTDSVTGTMPQLIKEMAVKPTTLITVAIRGQASAGHLTVELLEIYGGNNTIFTEQFTRTNTNNDVVFTRTFTRPTSAGAPLFVWIINGNTNGTSRLKDVVVRINSDTVIGLAPKPNLTTSTYLMQVQVSPVIGSNTLVVTLPKKQAGFITLTIVGTDNTPPVLSVFMPQTTYTQADSINIVGTAIDPSPVDVTINGQLAPMTNDTFRLWYHLPHPEGRYQITISAIDAAGNHTDAVATVIVDRTVPTVTIIEPLSQLITNQTTFTFSYTGADSSTLTFFLNGIQGQTCGPGSCQVFTSHPSLPQEGLNTFAFWGVDGAGNTSTTQMMLITRDTQRPTLTVSAPADGATVSTPTVAVTGTASDANAFTVKVNGSAVSVTNGAFSTNVALALGQNTITVIARDTATNADTVIRTVTRTEGLPPDPVTVATTINPAVPTTLATTTAFLYSGANPIQTGVVAGTITSNRAAVLRGKVITRDGDPLSGVAISVAGHPEFGQTLSRADGVFDMAVNGGGRLTVNYAKTGLLPAQRTVDAPWQDYTLVDDVAMIAVDPTVTTIGFTQPIEVARGSVVHDTDGTRQATMLFPQATTATMVFPNGSTQPLSSMHVRATEYSVAGSGRQTMPAELPPTSAYTYAVEFSVDEAMDAGAKSVTFSQPVPTYVENFLSFPIGLRVPAGYYDRQEARWVGAPNGRIVKILSETGGRADLDVTGSGQVSDAAALAALGITDAERAQLAQLYDPNQSFWRVAVTHFSPWDYNWPYTAGRDALPPPGDGPSGDDSPDNPDCSAGSIIECQSQTLREVVPITGTFPITYQSSRVPGYKAGRTLTIPLIGTTVPTGLKRIQLSILVAGKRFNQNFQPLPNQVGSFTWDGLDVYGRPVPGVVTARIGLSYLYRAVYTEPAAFQQSFAMGSDVVITAVGGGGGGGGSGLPVRGIPDTTDQGIYVSRLFERELGPWQPASLAGVGGWTFTVHHTYDPVHQVIHQGDGTQRSARNIGLVMKTFAGSGSDGFFDDLGDSLPATQGVIGSPVGVAVAPDGSVYVADRLWSIVRRIWPDGLMVTVAGTARNGGYGGDNGPATSGLLLSPSGVALGPDGSLYIADMGNQRVRRVDPQGTITTVAGTGEFGFDQDGVPATSAKLSNPISVAIGPDGSLYIADQGNHRIRRVDPSGIIQTVAGDGTQCFLGQLPESEFASVCKDNGPGTAAKLRFPSSVAVAPDGALLIGDGLNRRVRRVDLSGIITTVAGNGGTPGTGDGGPATGAGLVSLPDIAVGPDGSIYITQAQGSVSQEVNAIRRVGPNGIITTIAGTGTAGFGGDGGPSLQAKIANPAGIAVAPDGTLRISDLDNHRVRSVTPAVPGLGVGDVLIASEDGSELYVFNSAGRQVRTVAALGGNVRWSFAYDSAGHLTSITDAYGHETDVQRDGSGRPTVITAPFGQRTTITVNGDGYLASITNPAGHTITIAVDSVGLLDSLTDAEGGTSRYAYDSLGRLRRAENPSGVVKTIERRGLGSPVDTVSITTSLGRKTSYYTQRTAGDDILRTKVDPAGHVTAYNLGANGLSTRVAPDGSHQTIEERGEPRFGMTAPLIHSLSIGSPSGLEYTVSHTRRATLSDPTNPLSATSIIDSVGVSGGWLVGTFDAGSRTYTQVSPEGRTITAQIDSNGNLVQGRIEGLAQTSRTYNQHGQLIQWQQGGRTVGYGYDSLTGYLISFTDPLGRSTLFSYDSAEHIVRQELPNGRAIQYGYDRNGNLTSIQPPGRPSHLFQYTASNLVKRYVAPDVGDGPAVSELDYNLDDRVTQVRRADSSVISFAYDTAGRVSTVAQPRGVLTFQYDPTSGRLASLTAPDNGTLTYSYDGSLLASVVWGGAVQGSLSWHRDANLRVDEERVNNSNIASFEYDRDGLLVGAGDLRIGRSLENPLTVADTIGTIVVSTGYNDHGEPLAYSAQHNGATLYSAGYTRDSAGRVTQETETILGESGTLAFQYDSGGRLASVEKNGSPYHAYEYDDNGNRLSLVGSSGTLLGTYDAQDRLLTYGAVSFSYLKTGELHVRTVGNDSTLFNYDAFGNLMSAELPDGTSIEYVIDAQNRRVGRKINGVLVQAFLYGSQLNIAAELDAQGSIVNRFVYGTRSNVPDYLVRSGSLYRIISDQRGSVRLVVDAATGAVVQKLDYDEFGQVTFNSNPGFQPFAFAGGLYDTATGLLRFGTRDYDPSIGRWTAPDPVQFRGNEVNLYEYVLGDPVNFIDPHGFEIRTPANGPPNSNQSFPASDGGKTVRSYGPDGKAVRDVDYGHDHGAGDPHAHDWDWSRRNPRQPGRPIEPGDLPAAAAEGAGVGAGTVAAMVAVLMVIPLNALETPSPQSGWCQIEGWCPDPDPRVRKTPFCPDWLR